MTDATTVPAFSDTIRSVHGRSCSGAFTSDEAPAQRWAFEVDAMGAMDDAVENGVGQGGIANDFMPAIDRDLAGDQQRSSVVCASRPRATAAMRRRFHGATGGATARGAICSNGR